jgi:hypothetical protein
MTAYSDIPRVQPVAWTIPELCQRYRWTRTYVYEQAALGRLKAIKAGRRTLITDESSEAHFHSLPRATIGSTSQPEVTATT